MTRLSVLALTFLVMATAAGRAHQEAAQGGLEPLFDGRSLNGWQTIPLGKTPGTWHVRDSLLSFDSGDSWLATTARYTDFVLQLEYRAGADSDSGIFLRSTPDGYPSFTGMELEIKGDDAGAEPTARTTGAIYGAVAPLKSANKPAGEWNQVEVTLIGRRLTASWNGDRIHDVDLDDPRYAGALRGPLSKRAASGHIGMQAHLTGAPVVFRHIRIRTLSK